MLRREIRRSTSRLALAPLADDNATASPTSFPYCQGTPKGHFHCPATLKPKRVVALTELEDPFGPFANSECIKITQRDLRRCGDDLDLLRQCAAERDGDGRTLFEPCPSPAHGASACGASPCIAVGGRVVGIDKVTLQLQALREESEAEQARACNGLPCVKGRWSNMDQLPQLFERRGAGKREFKGRTLCSSGSSTCIGSGASSTCTSQAASRPVSRPGSNQMLGDAPNVSSAHKRSLSTPSLSACELPDL